MVIETPDDWVVLKVTVPNNPSFYKVLAGWRGGYLDSDSWKLNSGITLAFEREDTVDFYGKSGSLYHCRKRSYGVSASTRDIYKQLSAHAELMPKDTDWSKVKW